MLAPPDPPTQSPPPATTLRPSAPYPPLSPEAWGRLIGYLRQAQAHLQDPSLPEPTIGLLEDEEHGPLRQITRGYDEHGNPVLYFKVRNEAYKPRHAPPAVMLMLRLLIAMGGGCSVNDNGSGWAYIRPYSGNARLMLLRLVADAKAGEMVLQRGPSGRRADFRSQDPMWTTKVMVAKYGEVGAKPSRTPGSDREQAIGQALTIYRKTRKRSRIACSEAAYGAVLREVFALVDAIYRTAP